MKQAMRNINEIPFEFYIYIHIEPTSGHFLLRRRRRSRAFSMNDFHLNDQFHFIYDHRLIHLNID